MLKRQGPNTKGFQPSQSSFHILGLVFMQLLSLFSELRHSCTEGEIKYILFITYLDAQGTPGVSKDAPLPTKLGFGGLVL